jgi:hypothetical protein
MRPAKGAAEQCYGLIGLDVTLAWRFGAQAGLNVDDRIRRATEYGAELLRRHFGVVVLAGHYHPANPYRGSFVADADDALGFGGHVQYYTVRALAGSWLTRKRDFRRVGPATCAGLHLVRLGVDVHAHARARFLADLQWQFRAATRKDMDNRRMEKEKIEQILAARAAGDAATAAEIEKQLRRWDASFSKAGKTMSDIYTRNVATASKTQRPVDWVLSEEVTQFEAQRLAEDPAWAPLLRMGQQAAKEIETAHWRCGFSKSLSRLLLEWEARNGRFSGAVKALSIGGSGGPALAGNEEFVFDGRHWALPDLIDVLEEIAFLGQKSEYRGLVRAADGRPRDVVMDYLERMAKSGPANSRLVSEVLRKFDLAAERSCGSKTVPSAGVQRGQDD